MEKSQTTKRIASLAHKRNMLVVVSSVILLAGLAIIALGTAWQNYTDYTEEESSAGFIAGYFYGLPLAIFGAASVVLILLGAYFKRQTLALYTIITFGTILILYFGYTSLIVILES